MKVQKGDKVGIVCCSNGQSITKKREIKRLKETLEDIGLTPVFSNYIYQKEPENERRISGEYILTESGTPQERARTLMDFYKDDSIKAIFDISGGDLANTLLPYLDYTQIASSKKQLWGYSDLTSIINAIYAKTGRASVLYQVRNLVYAYASQQIKDFTETIFEENIAEITMDQSGLKVPAQDHSLEKSSSGTCSQGLYHFPYTYYQGNTLQGTVVGGNIRCLLKLAGTPYFPDFTDKILLLEARSGGQAQILAYFSQLEQLGAFKKVKGILLGTFTQMEEEQQQPDVYQLLKRYIPSEMPVIKTAFIGHGSDSRAIKIGEKYEF